MKDRMISLDVFRGITIAAMILVNNPGSWNYVFPPLRHAEWNGCTPTDLIFPFFLFIVGVSMHLSFYKHLGEGASRKVLFKKVMRRSLIIFALGLFLSGFPFFNLSTIRIPGVLQRIAVVYLFTSIIVLRNSWRGQSIWAVSLLVFYWIMMKFIPVPGYGAGDLSPLGNMAAFIDGKLLAGHMWNQTKVWDPEGFLSTIPAISTALTGVLAGGWLRSSRSPAEKTAWMFFIGNSALALGWALDAWFPINKSIWSSSYVVFTSGMALIFLSFSYWTVDVLKWRSWIRPFEIYGTNSIAVFVLSGLVAKLNYIIKFSTADGGKITLHSLIYNSLFASWLSPMLASLAWAISFISLFLLIMYLLDRKGIYIKV